MPKDLPKLQRVAAYALIIRDGQILLTQLASRISTDEKWHLPGGGLDHGEDPGAWRARLHEDLVALVGDDAARLRIPAGELVRALRLLTFSGSHPHIADHRLMTPEQIVDLVLLGALTDDDPTRKC